MRAIGQEIERGDGTAHEIIYGDEGTRMVRNFADAAGEIASVLEQVRQGDGTLHKLVYGSQGDSLVANLTQVSEDLKAISGRIREGKGTIGALIKDPSVYEDVKRLVGDLERNEILRSLVRYSIRRDEKVEATEVDRSEGGAE
jgi:phospholipid/cholesterol/gamma-HCH transport system substrate-binding protein